ncbi:MAG: 3'-5' exonuclease [Deltaproteobacteria bacterium]|nr:MAG: 3'-5' exonuclease [Deltaproteobacteria bacterium]
MTPAIVLDTETTGFPNNGAGFRGRIIEVGAVVITEDGRVVSPISFFVRQPRHHLDSWQARQSMRVHGIRPETVLSLGLEPTEAAPRFARWVERVQERHGVREVRAYNQGFDFWFLERSPWDLFQRTGLARGEDVQLTVRRALGRKSGPKLDHAVRAAVERGASLGWEGRAHRAQEDARIAAALAVFFGESG